MVEFSITDLLADLGLSPKEARMYVTLLRSGTQRTTTLARRAKLNRGTAFVILHQLLSRGLAMKTVRNKVQEFSPLEPAHLLHFLEHQQQEIREKRVRLQGMMGKLLAITNPHNATPKIEFFEGPEGARRVLSDTLTSKGKLLRAFLSIADAIEFTGADFFYDYTNRRIKSGYTLHAIRTLEKDKQAFALDPRAKRYVSNRKECREIRHVSENLAFPVTMYLYDDKLAILSSKEENFALLIESRELSEMQVKLFELLWKSLRGRGRG